MKQELINHVNKLVIAVGDIVKMQSASYRSRKEASDAYLSLMLLHDNFLLDAISLSSLEFLMNKIVDKICFEEYFNYYMCFYYLPHKVYDKNAEELSYKIFESNINISCFRCKMHASNMLNFSLDSSVDSYFFSRGSQIIKAISNYIKYPFEFDKTSMIYLILNYYQALNEYKNYADSLYNDNTDALIEDINILFDSITECDIFNTLIEENQQLLSFWNSIVPIQKRKSWNQIRLPETINNRHRWVLNSLYNFDLDFANKLLCENYEKITHMLYNSIDENFLIVRILCNALFYRGDNDLASYELASVEFDSQDRVKFGLNFFFKNYSNIQEQTCTQNDLDELFSFGDSTLRQKVAACMKNVDHNELNRQLQKPHGPLEISDLEIRFTEDGKIKYLCMPFKTGREITKASMDESYMYQLIKPFSHFGSQCIVVLITAKKCSQGLETYIERMSIREPSWRIEVIQESQLCKLLKANSQL